MNLRTLAACCGVMTAACVLAPTAAAGTQGEQWAMTSHTSMTKPMAMTMPAFTTKTCRAAKTEFGPPPMKNSDCKVLHWSHSGDRVSYEMTCNEHGSTFHGKGWSQLDGDSMKGHMSMDGSTQGMPMAMTIDYSGKRIGTCTLKDKNK